MRYNCSWQHRYIPERMLNTKDTYLELVFFLAKLAFGQRTAPALNTEKKCMISKLLKGRIQEKQLPDLAKTR